MGSLRGIMLIFLISHFLGDYYFQPEKLVEIKEKSWIGVLCHSLVHLLANTSLSALAFGPDVLRIAIVISIAHLIIDSVKKICNAKFEKVEFPIYLTDQFLHILSIVLICYFCVNEANLNFNQHITDFINSFSTTKPSSIIEKDFATLVIEKVLAILILWKPIALTVEKFLQKYKLEIKSSTNIDTSNSTAVDNDINSVINSENDHSKTVNAAENNDKKGLDNAGSKIGKLERLITFILASAGQFGTIGFVLAAKSITRYDKMTKDPAFGENYLLGTLASIASAILLAVLL